MTRKITAETGTARGVMSGLSDDTLLGAVPDYVSLPSFLKASAVTDGGKRYIYLEASNEDRDRQEEIVLQKALTDSSDFYIKHGNVDLGHVSILGPKSGIQNYMEYEIGKPVAVKVDGRRTFAKCELYQGDSAMARNANMVWDSLTRQTPAKDWYPSVGGAILSKSIRVDPETQVRTAVIDKVRWNNIALAPAPQNYTVAPISTAPIGVFAKSLNAFVMAKDLSAGYGADSAALTGGGAMREQSLYGTKNGEGTINYWDLRNKLAKDISSGAVGMDTGAAGLAAYVSKKFGLSHDHAAECVERFVRDLRTSFRRSRPMTQKITVGITADTSGATRGVKDVTAATDA